MSPKATTSSLPASHRIGYVGLPGKSVTNRGAFVEVADSLIDHDRNTKAPLYAESSVQEYWIVNVEAKTVEVHDQPANGRYARVRTVSRSEVLVPACFEDVSVPVDRLFE